MGYTSKAIQGISLSTLVKVGMTILSAVKLMILARIISKYDYGLFAFVAVAIGIVESITETGINATIIQSSKSVNYFLDTAWVISIVRGLLISIFMIFLGFGMEIFYDSPQLLTLVGVASFIPLIRGFINPAVITLHKDLSFMQDSVYRLSLLVVEVVASVSLGLLLRSVYALVFGLLISAVFEVALTFWMFKDRPRFIYLKSRAQEIFDNMRGLNIMAVLAYVVENMDSLIIGKVTSTSALGVYQNSYGLTHRFNLHLAKSVTHGTFPVYAKIQQDQVRLRRAFFRTLLISMVGFTLIGLPFYLFPRWTILFFLGENWIEAVTLVRPLIIAGLLQSVVNISSAAFMARRSYFWLNANLFVTALCMLTFIPTLGGQYGLGGAVHGVLLARAISLPIVLFGIFRVLYATTQQPRRWQS
jgi:lipopolysaccharide exporter